MKKLSKLIAILAVVALMATLCVSMAFAAKTNTEGAAVTKVLTLPKGVTVPNAEITIKATLKTVDGIAQTNVTPIEKTINLTSDLIKSDLTGDAVDVYYYATENMLEGIEYTHGGTYVYEITETSDLNTTNTDITTNTEIADDNVYTMTVYVDATGDIAKVTVYDEDAKKEIVDEVTTTNIDQQVSGGVVFKNALTQIIDTGDDPDNSVFKVGKTVVAGANGQADQTSEFAINVVVTFPTTTGAQTATYKIHKNGVATDAEETVTQSGTINLNLAHGEYIYFTSIPVGTKVSVAETDARAGSAADNKAYIKSGELESGTISETKINTTITNNTNDTEDTGILMNNLPYIILAFIALFGMTAYIIVRRRSDEA